MKKFLLIAVSLIAACQIRPQRPADTLVLRLAAYPPTLNPMTATDAISKQVTSYIFETLLRRNLDTLKLEPNLAERWSADEKSVVFDIRRDVTWHDGSKLNADDVIYSFETARKTPVYGAYLSGVDEIQKLGSHRVRITLRNPYFKMLEICGRYIPIIHAGSEGEIVGTGPYAFDESSGIRISLKRNDDYWGERPHIRSVEFSVVPDASSAFQMLKKNSIDAMEVRPLQWAKQTNTNEFMSEFDKYAYYPPNYSFIAWNTKRPMFADRRVRIAMTMLLNRDKMLEKVLFGEGKVVSSSFYYYGPGYDHSIKPYPYSPSGALKLLNEAGWTDSDGDGILDKNGVAFEFSYYYPSTLSLSRAAGVFLQGELRKIGGRMKLVPLEAGALSDVIMARDFDAVSLGIATSVDGDPFLLWHCSQAKRGFNLSGYCSGELDALLEKARTEMNGTKRAAIYLRMHRLLHDAEPVTFLFTVPSLAAVSKRLSAKPHRLALNTIEWKFLPGPPILEW